VTQQLAGWVIFAFFAGATITNLSWWWLHQPLRQARKALADLCRHEGALQERIAVVDWMAANGVDGAIQLGARIAMGEHVRGMDEP
jgi:hypothetical protein